MLIEFKHLITKTNKILSLAANNIWTPTDRPMFPARCYWGWFESEDVAGLFHLSSSGESNSQHSRELKQQMHFDVRSARWHPSGLSIVCQWRTSLQMAVPLACSVWEEVFCFVLLFFTLTFINFVLAVLQVEALESPRRVFLTWSVNIQYKDRYFHIYYTRLCLLHIILSDAHHMLAAAANRYVHSALAVQPLQDVSQPRSVRRNSSEWVLLIVDFNGTVCRAFETFLLAFESLNGGCEMMRRCALTQTHMGILLLRRQWESSPRNVNYVRDIGIKEATVLQSCVHGQTTNEKDTDRN